MIGSARASAAHLDPTPPPAAASATAAGVSQRGPLFLVAEVEVYSPGTAQVLPPLGRLAQPYLDLEVAAVLATAEVLRVSDAGYRTSQSDAMGVQVYPGRITNGFQLDRALDLDPAQPARAVGWGTLQLSNADARFDGYVATRNSDSRPVRVLMARKHLDTQRGLYLDPPYAEMIPLFCGVGSPWQLSDTELDIPLRDPSYLLERQVQQSTFGGTGSLDGTADLAGKCWPVLRGICLNVAPVLLDPVAYIYRVSDGPITVQGLSTGGDPTNYTYAGDVPDVTTQQPPPGTYYTGNAQGLIRLGNKPGLAVTVDATGAFPVAGLVTTALAIARTLMTETLGLPPSQIDIGRWIGADATWPYQAGIFYGTDPVTGTAAISTLLGSLGAKLVPLRTGQLSVFVLRALAPGARPATTWSTSELVSLVPQPLPATLDPPPYRWRIGYQPVWSTQTGSFDPDVTLARQQFLSAPFRYASWSDATLLAAYRSPNDPAPLPGVLARLADAQQVANDFGALWGRRRRLYTAEVPLDIGILSEIGDVVVLSYPVDDLAAGRAGQIVGESFQATDGTIKFPVLV